MSRYSELWRNTRCGRNTPHIKVRGISWGGGGYVRGISWGEGGYVGGIFAASCSRFIVPQTSLIFRKI